MLVNLCGGWGTHTDTIKQGDRDPPGALLSSWAWPSRLRRGEPIPIG